MKKLVLLLAVVFSVSFFSCNNAEQAQATTDTVDSTEVVAAVDTTAADTAAAAPAAEAAAPAAEAAAPAAE